MKFSDYPALIAVSALLALTSCKEYSMNPSQNETAGNSIEFSEGTFKEELRKQLALNGIDTASIVEFEEYWTFDDREIRLAPLRAIYQDFIQSGNSNSASLSKIEQRGISEQCSGISIWRTCMGGLVSDGHISTIKIKNNVASISSALSGAVTKWNNSGSKIYMKIVTSGEDLAINASSTPHPNGWMASTAYGWDGKPGSSMTIYPSGLNCSSGLITHELSHCVNFAHTNEPNTANTYHIAGTPATDAGSMFNSVVFAGGNFTQGDLSAIHTQYPLGRDPELTYMGDVSGDGRPDLIIIGRNGVNVAVAAAAGFGNLTLWVHEFSYEQGWSKDLHPCLFGDVDGDKKTDIVGFSSSGTIVAISTGTGFTVRSWSNDFCYNAGWRVSDHPRLLADVTGDGKADVVGFANGGTTVGRSTGTSFVSENWSTDFCYNAGWRVSNHPRLLADVTGDGKADVVGFASGGTTVGRSTGTSFVSTTWSADFCYNAGWRVSNHPRLLADVTGDGKADVVGFASGGTTVGRSTGTSFVSTTWSTDFCYNAGWRVADHPRLLADVTGDGKADVVGFANGGTTVGRSTGSSFVSTTWSSNFCYSTGWRANIHPRMLADVTGDGKKDVVGLGTNEFIVGSSTGQAFSSSTWLQYIMH